MKGKMKWILAGVMAVMMGVVPVWKLESAQAMERGVEIAAKEDEEPEEEEEDTGDPLCKRDDVDADLKEALGCNTKKTVPQVAVNVVQVVIALTGIVAVGAIIYGGVIYISSAGDPAKAKRARDIIIYSVVGLIVAVLAQAIVTFVTKAAEL